MRFSCIQINNFYNLKDVDLDLSSGSALIVGPNGSGKSNIIKCVEGLVKLLTYNVKFGSGTWSERADKALIKIQARLSRKEVEIMCRLHAIFITCDVILIANMIIDYHNSSLTCGESLWNLSILQRKLLCLIASYHQVSRTH